MTTLPAAPLDGQPIPQDWNLAIYDLPWGYVASATYTSAQNGVSTEVDVTSATVTITAVAGRRYKVTGEYTVFKNTAGLVRLRVYGAGSAINGAGTLQYVPNGAFGTLIATAIHEPGAGSITYKLRGSCDAGTIDIGGNVTPTRILVEDIGAA